MEWEAILDGLPSWSARYNGTMATLTSRSTWTLDGTLKAPGHLVPGAGRRGTKKESSWLHPQLSQMPGMFFAIPNHAAGMTWNSDSNTQMSSMDKDSETSAKSRAPEWTAAQQRLTETDDAIPAEVFPQPHVWICLAVLIVLLVCVCVGSAVAAVFYTKLRQRRALQDENLPREVIGKYAPITGCCYYFKS